MSNADARPFGSLETFLEEHHDTIYDTVDAICRVNRFDVTEDVKGDLAAEIEYKLLRNNFRYLRSFEHRSSFRTWLTKVALHHIHRHLLRRQALPVALAEIPDEALLLPPRQEAALIEADRIKRLRGAFGQLCEQERLYLYMTCVEEIKATEIASRLGITLGAVYQRRSRLLKKMRGLMK